jgi:REP element-mobilizing transposase RayT
VTYYVTFRHRRPLEAIERRDLLAGLLRTDGRDFEMVIVCVLPERTEMMFRQPGEEPPDLSKIIEAAKRKAGKKVLKRTGEPWTPFYGESYDRIVRDAAEFEDRFREIGSAPVAEDLVEEAEAWDGLWIAPASEQKP